VQEVVERRGIDARDRLLARDPPLAREVHRDPHRGARGALAGARLEQPQAPALDRELDVLHVAVVALEPHRDPHQLAIGARHLLLERRQHRRAGNSTVRVDRTRRADARHHVLALRVHQVLAVEHALAVVRIARERDAGGAVIAHVPEHHRLHVHRGAERLGDPVQPAVATRALVAPGAEHRRDRAPELALGILGKRRAGVLAHDREEVNRDVLELGGGELGVVGHARGVAARLEHRLKALRGHAEHNVAVHLDEAPEAVEREALSGLLRETAHGRVGQAEIEHGVHHAGHRDRGSRSHRHEQRILRVAEARTRDLLDARERAARLGEHRLGQLASCARERARDVGGDREARRHRHAEPGHLGEVRALSAEHVAQLRVAVGAPVSEEVDAAARALLPFFHAARPSRSATYAPTPPIAIRSWVIESRSRTVTFPSPPVSKSIVTQKGVPASSWRR
jgi:hypothetical protein